MLPFSTDIDVSACLTPRESVLLGKADSCSTGQDALQSRVHHDVHKILSLNQLNSVEIFVFFL
jgi:hypothetical protein